MADDHMSFDNNDAEHREGDPSASGLESNPNLRYVIIEYKLPYEPVELSRRDPGIRTGLLEESGFRGSTLVSGFKHANLVLLQSNTGINTIEGVRWSVGKNNQNLIRVKRGVQWQFLPSSRFVLEGFTLKDNSEVNAVVDQCIKENSSYKLLANNCEVFCKAVSRNIILRGEAFSFSGQHYRHINETFKNLGATGILYQDIPGLSWTFRAAFGSFFLVCAVLYWLGLALLIYFISHWIFPEYSRHGTIFAIAMVLITITASGFNCFFQRPSRENERSMFESTLTEYEKKKRTTWYVTMLTSSMLFFFLFGLGTMLVVFLLDGRNPRNVKILYIVCLSSFLISLAAWGISWQIWKPREHERNDDYTVSIEDEEDVIGEPDNEQQEILEPDDQEDEVV